MKITVETLRIEYTPALASYIERKFKLIKKLLSKLETKGEYQLALDISKTTRHHRKGQVFRAEANLKIGKTLLRAETVEETVLAALDVLKNELKQEVIRFKEKFATKSKRESSR